MKYLIGIDVGTSGTKAVLFDLEGNTVFSALCEYDMAQPAIGWAEQNPEDWWHAVCGAIKKIVDAKQCAKDIAAIGLTGQMHGVVALGAHNEVLRPSIIWCDQRSSEECAQITDLVGDKVLRQITANPALTGFSAAKLMWIKNNEPDIFSKIQKVVLPKDYIRYRLTGVFATEVSDASGTQFLDVANRTWSESVVNAMGFKVDWLPEVFESTVITGYITPEAAALTGLIAGTPVAGGGSDQAAGGVGNGIVKTGVVSSTIGTSGVVFAHTDELSIDPEGRVHTFCHCVPGKWHVMGVTQAAGLSLRWFRDHFCATEKEVANNIGKDVYEIMSQEAAQSPVGSKGVVYLPYLMGERTPHLDPHAKGVFYGLSAVHNKNDMLRAVMEGVAYSLTDCMGIVRRMSGEVSEVRASGGGGKSSLWRQIQADMFNTDITTLTSNEGPCLGAALIAGCGVGVYNDLESACDIAIKTDTRQKPIEENVKCYEQNYKLYRALYPALAQIYKDFK